MSINLDTYRGRFIIRARLSDCACQGCIANDAKKPSGITEIASYTLISRCIEEIQKWITSQTRYKSFDIMYRTLYNPDVLIFGYCKGAYLVNQESQQVLKTHFGHIYGNSKIKCPTSTKIEEMNSATISFMYQLPAS